MPALIIESLKFEFVVCFYAFLVGKCVSFCSTHLSQQWTVNISQSSVPVSIVHMYCASIVCVVQFIMFVDSINAWVCR